MQNYNLPMEGHNIGGSEQPCSSSDGGQFVVALKEMIKKEIEVVVIRTVHQVIGRVMDDLVRKAVKEEIQLALAKLLDGGTQNQSNEMTVLNERSLQLMFLGEVCDPVLTGKEIKTKKDTPLKVALVDKTTGHVVSCGPESSVKVEIVLLDASSNDDGHNWSLEDFNNRIIKEGEKEKPHFVKSYFISLQEGVGVIHNAKLGQGSSWTKNCKCRLGARIVENLRGVQVQAAWTESIMVRDSRIEFNKKHYPPSLSDNVWRLKNIGKDGPLCKRLNNENICTVQELLFWHAISPQKLQETVGDVPNKKWQATVDHAQTCIVGDDKRMKLYYPSSELKMGVVLDVVGGMKGVIHDSHYVPINDLSAHEKDCAYKLLLSAFENRGDIKSFDDETSLLRQFPYRSSDANAATNSSIQDVSHDCDSTISQNSYVYIPTMADDTSSQSIISQFTEAYDDPNDSCHFGSIGTPFIEQQSYDTYSSDLDPTPSYQISNIESVLTSLFPSFSENLIDESHSHKQTNAGRIGFRLLVRAVRVAIAFQAGRKRSLALAGTHNVQKRQRI